MASGTILTVEAEPYEFACTPAQTALVVIDMQRDFVEPGGFGEMLGNDVALLRRAVEPTRRVLEAFRAAGLAVVHTREGHRPNLSDCPPTKRARGRLKTGIGDRGPMGRILVRGEHGHAIIAALAPRPGEPVIDKPGKGAFYATDLIDGRFTAAAGYAAGAAVLSFCGFVHGSRLGWAEAPQVALSYLLLAVVCALMARRRAPAVDAAVPHRD